MAREAKTSTRGGSVRREAEKRKDSENGVAKSSAKKRPKSPEIRVHNMKVLRKKSAMRRRKLAKEVLVVNIVNSLSTTPSNIMASSFSGPPDYERKGSSTQTSIAILQIIVFACESSIL